MLQGDVLDVARGERLRDLGPFDALFCDPPYGIKFMGAEWDHGVPSDEVWRALSGHLRPGASVVAFGGTRTWHRLAVAMEDAGLEMRDSLMAWMYGTGWPKPGDVSKYVDVRLGAERRVTGPRRGSASKAHLRSRDQVPGPEVSFTAPTTLAARRFSGWHANLAPSWEPALMFRVPLNGTLANNALANGLAGLWVDGARVGTTKRVPGGRPSKAENKIYGAASIRRDGGSGRNPEVGRWPKNAILCCEEETCGDADPGGEHAPGCPVHELQVQGGVRRSGRGDAPGRVHNRREPPAYTFGHGLTGSTPRVHGDEGFVSRFFYVAKVSRKERTGIPHPCMKPIALCRQIATLLLPPPRADGQPRRILVPYSGSGSEMIGCLQAGWDEVVGVEMEPAWVAASRERVARELVEWDARRAEDLEARRRTYVERLRADAAEG